MDEALAGTGGSLLDLNLDPLSGSRFHGKKHTAD
jgi:hypothetical protein